MPYLLTVETTFPRQHSHRTSFIFGFRMVHQLVVRAWGRY